MGDSNACLLHCVLGRLIGRLCRRTATQAPIAETKPVKPVQISAADTAAIHTGIKRVLKDPESARFGEIAAGIDDKGDTIACVHVNAKNGFGGYTGMKTYMGMLTNDKPRRFVVAGGVPDHLLEHRDQATYKVCNDFGLRLSG
jgi:hypothetical protein